MFIQKAVIYSAMMMSLAVGVWVIFSTSRIPIRRGRPNGVVRCAYTLLQQWRMRMAAISRFPVRTSRYRFHLHSINSAFSPSSRARVFMMSKKCITHRNRKKGNRNGCAWRLVGGFTFHKKARKDMRLDWKRGLRNEVVCLNCRVEVVMHMINHSRNPLTGMRNHMP